MSHAADERAEAWRRQALDAGPLTLDPATHEAVLDGDPIYLTPTEFNILYHLAAHPRRIYDAGRLYAAAWGEEKYGSTATVRVAVQRIRAKLGPHRGLVGTVRHVGYKFTGKAVPVPREPAPPEPDADDPATAAGLAEGIRAAARVLAGMRPEDAEAALDGLRTDAVVRWMAGAP